MNDATASRQWASRPEETYDQRLVTLEIGLAGCHGQTQDGSSLTIYDSRLSCYYGELAEGGWVLDKSAVLDRQPSLAVLAPMCKGDLPQGQRDTFRGAQDSFVARTLAASPENGYCGLARMMLAAPECGAFDYVAPDVYAAWWRQHGARIGRRQGDRIAWENGDNEPIRPASQRWQVQPTEGVV